MNDLIKNSIQSRKDSIFNVYTINDKNILEEIDELFRKMEELGSSCQDLMEFETKLASSELNNMYINIFAKIAQNPNNKLNYTDDEVIDKKQAMKEIKDDAIRPIKRLAKEEARKELRTTPIIGDIMGAKQVVDLFGGIKRKKKAKEEQEQLRKELGLDDEN